MLKTYNLPFSKSYVSFDNYGAIHSAPIKRGFELCIGKKLTGFWSGGLDGKHRVQLNLILLMRPQSV